MSKILIALAVAILLTIALSFVFQDPISYFFLSLVKPPAAVSFWSTYSVLGMQNQKPIWYFAKLDFVNVPLQCTELGYNAFHPIEIFGEYEFCADVVCSNGDLTVLSQFEAKCLNPTGKCSYGVFDEGSELCLMNICSFNSDCSFFESENCFSPFCAPFGKGIYRFDTEQFFGSFSYCTCAQ